MFCEKCGTKCEPGAAFCPACGKKLVVAPVEVSDGGIFFPKNTMAIWSYYLGIASFLFCFLTGIPALISGIVALRRAGANPALKGEFHAWFGIVIGVLSIVLPIVFIILILR